MWREIRAPKCRLLEVDLRTVARSSDPCFPAPNVIPANEIGVQLYLNFPALPNCHRFKPREKQLAIYGSCRPWPGRITDFLEELCLEPQTHSVCRSVSHRAKMQFCGHSCRSSHGVVE